MRRVPTKLAMVEIGRGRGIGEQTSQRADTAFVGHGGDVGRWDELVHRARRKVAVVRHSRPSREQIAGDLESQALRRRHFEGRPAARTVDETTLLRRPADKSRQSRRGIFLTSRVVSFCAEQGPGREEWSSPRPEARRPCRRGKGREGGKRGFTELLKRWRTSARIYLSRSAGWQIGRLRRHAGHGGQ
jgi:hypothetical protein